MHVQEKIGKPPPELADMPPLWAENAAAWQAWVTLTELGEGKGMADIAAAARLLGLDAILLARKLAAVEMVKADWIRQREGESR